MATEKFKQKLKSRAVHHNALIPASREINIKISDNLSESMTAQGLVMNFTSVRDEMEKKNGK